MPALIQQFHPFMLMSLLNVKPAYCFLLSRRSSLFDIFLKVQVASRSMSGSFLILITLIVQSIVFDYQLISANLKSLLQALKYFQLFRSKPIFTVVQYYFFSTAQFIFPFFFSMSRIQVFFFSVPLLFAQMLAAIDQAEDFFALRMSINFWISLKTIRESEHLFQAYLYMLNSRQPVFYKLTHLICFRIGLICPPAKLFEELKLRQLQILSAIIQAYDCYVFPLQDLQFIVNVAANQPINSISPQALLAFALPFDLLATYQLRGGFRDAIIKWVLKFTLNLLAATIIYLIFDSLTLPSLHL